MVLKIFLFILFAAICNVIREVILFYYRVLKPNEINTKSYDISNTRIALLCASISYIMTIIFSGFNV